MKEKTNVIKNDVEEVKWKFKEKKIFFLQILAFLFSLSPAVATTAVAVVDVGIIVVVGSFSFWSSNVLFTRNTYDSM